MSTLEETNSGLNANIAHYNSLMNSNSLSSGPASIPDFSPLSDAFDMTPTPSEADAMSVRATVSLRKNLLYDVKLNPKLPLCCLERFSLSIKK